jgi:tight adherence protein B
MATSLGFMLAFGGVLFVMFLTLSVPMTQNSSQKRLLRARLKDISAEESAQISQLIANAKLKKLSPVAQTIETLPWLRTIRTLIMHAGVSASVFSVLNKMALLGAGALAVLLLLKAPLGVALGIGLLCGFIPLGRLVMIRNKRLAQIEEQLPEALDMMKRSLQVGHPFAKTLQVVAEEMGGPLGNEFGLVSVDINYGASVESAMNALIERVPSVSLTALVATVAIQRETGGSLSETLEKISDTIRGRFQFQRQLRTLTAESRLSAWILGFAPFVLFIIMYVIMPDVMGLLIETPEGHSLLIKGGVGILLGCFWMRRILQGVNK